MNRWLDTETKALLRDPPPDKLAPPDTDMVGFTLVLLSIFHHHNRRLARAFARILRISLMDARIRVGCPLPTPVKPGLSYNDAEVGQFELIACDAISVILDDDVFRGASQPYLNDLYDKMLNSSEFEEVPIRIESIPRTNEGDDFIDQFLSDEDDDIWRTQELIVLRKKARIMQHWAANIGGAVSVGERQ